MARQWLRRHPFLHLWLPLLAWMGLIFYLSAQPDLPHPDVGWADLLVSNGAHATVFGVLAVLWARALEEHPRTLLVALALTLLYALSDEFHQAFVPGRNPDPWDLAFDGLGAAVGLGLWIRWKRRQCCAAK
jgi:VanZ family protein